MPDPNRAAMPDGLVRRVTSCAVLALALAACVKVERQSGIEPLRDRRLLAREVVVARDGGTLRATLQGKLHEGVGLVVPPGALERDTQISIWVRYGNPRFPSVVQSFELEPTTLRLALPATLTIQYAREYEAATADIVREREIEVFSVDVDSGGFRHHPTDFRNTDRNLLTCATDRLGTFFGLHPAVHALLLQAATILDPTEAIPVRLVQGQALATPDGPQEVRVGKGNLDSFWSSGPARNLLILHGLMGTPFQLLSEGSLVPSTPTAGFNGDFDNVVVFQYPSGRSLAGTANLLYDEIAQRHRTGFGCSILAHSTGGLIARYAIERSHTDPARAGYSPSDAALSELVDRVVFVGAPNQGSPQVRTVFEQLLRQAPADDLPFLEGILDLVPGPSSFTDRLNADWQKPATLYFAIAGDASGARTDGIVEVLSAVGLPEAWLRPDAFQVFSGPLYDHASLIALAQQSGVLTQARVWLDKAVGNTPPAVGSVATPDGIASGVVEIAYAVSDADEEPCQVTAEYSFDGRRWFPATPDGGGPPVFAATTAPAPGRSHAFAWDSRADRVAEGGRRARVSLRLSPVDASGRGTPGRTGLFYVEN